MDIHNILNEKDGASGNSGAHNRRSSQQEWEESDRPQSSHSDKQISPRQSLMGPGPMFPHAQYPAYIASTSQTSAVPQLSPTAIGPSSEAGPSGTGDNPAKPYHCKTKQKGFARRSDLSRHERIHSGVRPHVCDFPGCGKQFIQRSALTVHARVHTGEKPHMCEACGKPFSDSSSLARHRRIHSGKRPYKCPYADCQKTFTRRTTLTRHQNHHTGTLSEAAAATAAALATRRSSSRINVQPSQLANSQANEDSAESVSQSYTSSNSPLKDSQGSITRNSLEKITVTWRPDEQHYQTMTPRPTPTTTPTIPPTLVSGSSYHRSSQSFSSHKILPTLTALTTSLQPLSLSPRYSGGSPTTPTPPLLSDSPGLLHQQWQPQVHHGSPTSLFPLNSSPRSYFR